MNSIDSQPKKKKGIINFLVLASGSMLGQGMAILFAPVLSRIYTKDQMGTYTLILTAVGMFESLICLRYDLILVSEKNENHIRSLVFSCIKISIFLSAVITASYTAYLILADQIPLEKIWIGGLIFFALLFSGVILVLTAINNRQREYKNIALSSFTQGIIHNGVSALLGLMNAFSFLGLIIGRILGYISYIIVSLRTDAVRSINKQVLLPAKERRMILYEHKNQALLSTPSVMLSSVSYSIVNLFLSQLYGREILGLYSYSYRILGLPLAVVGANISRMFFKDASVEYQQNGTMRQSFVKMFIPVFALSLIMVTVFFIFGPTLFAVFLGEHWRESGVFVQILAPMYGVRLVSNSFVNATIVKKKQIIPLALQSFYLVTIFAVYFICKIYSLDIYSFLNIMNYSFCAIYTIYFAALAYISLKKEKR